MEELPAYQLTKSDYYTHAWDLPPQLGGCRSEEGSKPYEDAINGVRSLDGTQGSWELPLQADNGGIEPDWTFIPGGEPEARREAVERISANHDAIVKFACRGAGNKGFPNFGAALADPNAVPNEALQNTIDKCFRTICSALLADNVDGHNAEMEAIAKTIVSEGGKEYTGGVIASLAYLRDRVGVPRDMRLPAAQQLRAHLNWSIGAHGGAAQVAAHGLARRHLQSRGCRVVLASLRVLERKEKSGAEPGESSQRLAVESQGPRQAEGGS